uniref:DENR N-terminal domain-containing protein n=1 Tax=Ditylenchus dipsaci TaxID=166011 RepID=A0A915D4M9_9BILA
MQTETLKKRRELAVANWRCKKTVANWPYPNVSSSELDPERIFLNFLARFVYRKCRRWNVCHPFCRNFLFSGSDRSRGGPVPGVCYPLKVYYCGECSMPIEYCEYSGKVDKCRQWLEKNLPELVDELQLDNGDSGQDGKKHQKRGGKGTSKADKPSAEKEKVVKSKITIQRAPRSKTKSVTVIKGLGTFGIDLKVAPNSLPVNLRVAVQ